MKLSALSVENMAFILIKTDKLIVLPIKSLFIYTNQSLITNNNIICEDQYLSVPRTGLPKYKRRHAKKIDSVSFLLRLHSCGTLKLKLIVIIVTLIYNNRTKAKTSGLS